MTSLKTPQWWNDLTGDNALRIEWRDPGAWESPDDTESGTLRNDATIELDARIREGKLLVGTGPSVTTRGMPIEVDARWFLDPESPDRLWCALGHSYDPRLWIPVDPTPDAIAEVLSSSHPKPALERVSLTSFVRGFVGFREQVSLPNVYSGDMVPFNGHDLDRYTTMMSYLEHSSWASSHNEDPLGDDFEVSSTLAMSAFTREHRTTAQLLGRVPSMTWRTLHSRSHLSFEIHSRALVCAAVRYRPSPKSHHAVVERINADLVMGYPLDLPLDVVGALTCFDFATDDDLEHHLREPETLGHLTTAIRIFAALWHGDLRKNLRLREFARHPEPEVRRELMRVAATYDYRFLFEEIAVAQHEGDPVAQLEDLFLLGNGADNYNAFGDYFSGEPVMIDRDGNPVDIHSDFIGDGDIEEDEDDDEEEEDR